MNILKLSGLSLSSVLLVLIPLLIAFHCTESIEQDASFKQGEFLENHEQQISVVRRKRSPGVLEYLAERRRKRNYTSTLGIQMKNWLNIEVTKRDEQEQMLINHVSVKGKPDQDKNKATKAPNKPHKDKDYTAGEEQAIEYETNTDDTTDGKPSDGTGTETTEPEPKNRTIVYNQTEFVDLCKDPVFESADSSLDGTEILIFKGDTFYVMEDLRYGSGNLITSGQISELLPKFDAKGFTSMVTIKEGAMRGYTFAFYDKPERAGWAPVGYTRAKHVNEFKKKSLNSLPKKGFQAALHNRDLINPLLVGLNDEKVYYYKTDNKTFTKVKEVKHDLSDEKFPSGITAGFSMPNGYLYLFRGKQYCVREMYFEVREEGVYCDLWLDNRVFLGCYGQYPPPYSMEADIENYSGLKGDDLCDNFKRISLEKSVDGLTVMAFKEDKYFNVHHFPVKPEIKGQTLIAEKWKGFESNPDAVLLVPEGQHLRGSLFSFKKGKYSQWAADGKPLEQNKKIEKFNAIIHNSDILKPMAVAFDEKTIYYYSTDSTTLKLIKTMDYSQTDENWPKGITTGLTINTNNIYLFRGDTYCQREWKCSDKKTNCCNKWLSAKQLFRCS